MLNLLKQNLSKCSKEIKAMTLNYFAVTVSRNIRS